MSRQKVLVLCTGNSCRSQMAEGFLRSFDPNLDVNSAGTKPSERVHPMAVEVMNEIGIDISRGRPKHVDGFTSTSFDHLITVCEDADRTCPHFSGEVARRVHIGFEDPARAEGTEPEVRAVFRRIRDEIRHRTQEYYEKEIKQS